ncbi:helix-turn-helix domain-containing protein [Austwickia chelonae]|uniref:helix-turn-helix domain-containing protein n=1 Tax=Austwickia chelonae TaxID=100225 RepID=UPI0013C2DF27
MLRRLRLQEAVEWARKNSHKSLAPIAAHFGFTDQTHLSRETRTVVGLSLTDYRLHPVREPFSSGGLTCGDEGGDGGDDGRGLFG